MTGFLATCPREVQAAGGDLRCRALVAVFALAVNIGFYLPDIPGEASAGIPGIDKVYHVGAFAITVWAVGRLLAPRRRFPMGWVVLAAITHAVVIEGVQGALLPHRSSDPEDVLADAVGAALGVLAWWIERRWRLRA